eukprot:935817-Pyramimonas_sp.AAC.1
MSSSSGAATSYVLRQRCPRSVAASGLPRGGPPRVPGPSTRLRQVRVVTASGDPASGVRR